MVLMLGFFLLALDVHFADRSSLLIRIWALNPLGCKQFLGASPPAKPKYYFDLLGGDALHGSDVYLTGVGA